MDNNLLVLLQDFVTAINKMTAEIQSLKDHVQKLPSKIQSLEGQVQELLVLNREQLHTPEPEPEQIQSEPESEPTPEPTQAQAQEPEPTPEPTQAQAQEPEPTQIQSEPEPTQIQSDSEPAPEPDLDTSMKHYINALLLHLDMTNLIPEIDSIGLLDRGNSGVLIQGKVYSRNEMQLVGRKIAQDRPTTFAQLVKLCDQLSADDEVNFYLVLIMSSLYGLKKQISCES